MKNAIIMAALCLPLLFGCGKSEVKKAQPAAADAMKQQQREDHLVPYYAGLIEEYRTILEEDPNNLASIIALGNAYFDSSQWKKAIVMYEHALLIDPKNGDVRTDMGTSYRNIGMTDRALAEYRTVFQHDPVHLNARYNIGIIYAYNKGNFKAAIRVWEDLLKLAPNYPRAEDIKASIITLKNAHKRDAR